MTDTKALGAQAIRAIDDRRGALIKLSLSLHAEPEIAYQEHRSTAKLATLFQQYIEFDFAEAKRVPFDEGSLTGSSTRRAGACWWPTSWAPFS